VLRPHSTRPAAAVFGGPGSAPLLYINGGGMMEGNASRAANHGAVRLDDIVPVHGYFIFAGQVISTAFTAGGFPFCLIGRLP